jgi:predicted GNAT family acetyltransferase
MSFGFDLNEKKPENILASGNIESIEESSPTFFEGAGTGISEGIMKGGANVGRFLGMAGSAAPIAYDAFTNDTKAQDWYYENIVEDTLTNAVDYWTPDAKEVGKAGQLLGGLAGIALPLMATGGNPSLLIGESYANPSIDLVNQGVDANTAGTVGAINAAATGVGFYLPFLGKNLSQRMASGIAGNLVVNTGATAAQQQVLENTGNREIAEQYDPFDTTARTLDVLTGAVFGGLAHMGAPRIKLSERDAILTANNAKNFQHDSAPGTPLDISSSVAHQNALTESLNQISRGEQVDVSSLVENAIFIQRTRGEDPAITLPENVADDGLVNGGMADEVPPPLNDFKEISDDKSFFIASNRMTDEGIESFKLETEVKNGVSKVINSYVEPGLRGQGIAKAMYKMAILDAESKGLKFKSDNSISDKALNVYRSLEKEGYVFKYNTENAKTEVAYPENPTEKRNQIINKYESVVELVSSPRNSNDIGRTETAPEVVANVRPDELVAQDTVAPTTKTNEPINRDFEEANKILVTNPNLMVALDDGDRVSVRELMDNIAAENKQFENDSKAYEAAVNCFLGGA